MSYIGKKNGNPNTDFLEAGGELENHDLVNVDSSGNLLVGKTTTSSANSTQGTNINSNGRMWVTSDSASTAHFSRKTTNGDIVEFSKGSTIVGKIGVEAGDNFYIADNAGNSGLNFKGFVNPVGSNGETRDAAIDLGNSGGRFKDLYLSGGVYVGGTGSANYLDDYEEGTWTPTISDASSGGNTATAYSVRSGKYVKVGNQITVNCYVTNFNTTGMTSSNGIYIQGFPFATDSSTQMTAAVYNTRSSNGGYTGGPIAYMSPSTTFCSFRIFINDKAQNTYLMQVGDNTSTVSDFIFTATYICAN